MYRLTYILRTLLCAALLLPLVSVAESSSKKVLILNSYHPNFQWSDALVSGVSQGLAGTIPDENILIEYLDARRFADDTTYYSELNRLMHYKYRISKPDVIITNDDFAFNFVTVLSEGLFQGIPVVFTGLNALPKHHTKNDNFTGVMEGMDAEGNLRLIMSLYPQLRRLVIVGGGSVLDLQLLNYLRSWSDEYVKREQLDSLEFLYWVGESKASLFDKAAKLGKGDAVLFTSMQKFSDGQYFSYPEHLGQLSKLCNAPIFGMYGAMSIGNGLLGGRLNKPVEQGKDAAGMAIAILNGTKPGEIPIIDKLKYECRFDYGQMKRFGISVSRLPEGCIIEDMPDNFIINNRYLLIISIVIVLLLLIVIFVLIVNVRKRRQAEEQLRKFNILLENTISERTLELETSQSELRQSNNDKIKFFSILAHDLRAPFNAIMGFSHILGIDNEELTLDEAKEYGRNIYDSSQSMFRLLENLLDWSRVMNKTKVASPVHFPFETIINQNFTLLESNAQAKNIEFVAEGDISAMVYADFNMMNSVIQNLLSNAIKFTHEGGKVRISVFSFQDNPFVDVQVVDNGVGMTDETRRNLFKMDTAQTTPGTNNEKGSGLGLMLCKEFIEMNKGEISVSSELDKGSTITLRLRKDLL